MMQYGHKVTNTNMKSGSPFHDLQYLKYSLLWRYSKAKKIGSKSYGYHKAYINRNRTFRMRFHILLEAPQGEEKAMTSFPVNNKN